MIRKSVWVFPAPGRPVMPILTGGERRRGMENKCVGASSRRGANKKASRPGTAMQRIRTPTERRGSRGAIPSVYPPREDSFLLLPFATVAPGTRVLEVGAGSGIAAMAAGRAGARVVATDRNPGALARLREAARSEGLDLECVRTDLAHGLGRFDRVLSNPPYLPTQPEERDPDPWTSLALDGGPDGCRVLARLLHDLADHLAPRGEAYVVVSTVQDASALDELAGAWRAAGGRRSVVASRSLEGERLDVWRLGVADRAGRAPAGPATAGARRSRGSRGGTSPRPRTPSTNRSASSPAPAPGRAPARGAASGRRRSLPGS